MHKKADHHKEHHHDGKVAIKAKVGSKDGVKKEHHHKEHEHKHHKK